MAIALKKFHEIIIQILYCFDMGEGERGELTSILMQELKVSRKIVDEAYEKALLIWQKKGECDQKMTEASESYDIERIGKVERSILRFSLATGIDQESITEALRLTRKFCGDSACAFVHAILDHLSPKRLDASLSA